MMDMNASLGAEIRNRVIEILTRVPDFPDEAMITLNQASPDGQAGWFLGVALNGFIFFIIGLFICRLVNSWARKQFAPYFRHAPETRADKISFLWFRGFFQALGAFACFLTGAILAFAFNQKTGAALDTQLIIVGLGSVILLIHFVFLNLSSKDLSAYRMFPLDDAGARCFYNDFVSVLSFAMLVLFLCWWMSLLGLQKEAHKLALIIGSTMIALMAIGIVIIRYRGLSTFIERSTEELRNKAPFLSVLVRMWHVIFIVYFVAAWGMNVIKLLLDETSAIGLAIAPVTFGYAAIAIYGALLLIIDKINDRTDPYHRNRFALKSDNKPDLENGETENFSTPGKSLKKLVERGAMILVAFAYLACLLNFWGVDVASKDSFLVGFSDIFLILFLAYMAYEAVHITIDRKIEQEGGDVQIAPGEEGGSAGSASRLATLLPMFRNALLITIIAIAGMILLSQSGVDVAPLFAGAGVIGLAVGFGAQTLIRDIFSGAFFLIDDAFRKGEYIDIGQVKGTVERISIRSLQLRHHLGALHTIPFGEIQHLTNFSRDWVMMKLTLRVTYDTDIEKVRKLIKKLGQELMEDPTVGANFLQPLKSQGVYKMEDSAMILRVKFMTRPGEQFVVRKMVYARIRELFASEGIKFAHREVTVRLAGENGEEIDQSKISQEDKKRIAGAVLPDDTNPQGTPGR